MLGSELYESMSLKEFQSMEVKYLASHVFKQITLLATILYTNQSGAARPDDEVRRELVDIRREKSLDPCSACPMGGSGML